MEATHRADSDARTGFLLFAGSVLLPLQIWPPMPLPGMQASDVFFALAFAHFVWAHFAVPPAVAAVPITAFAAGAAASALFGGSPVKLLGHFELAALGWMAACASPASAAWLRRGLVLAAGLAALTAIAGLAVFFLGFGGYDAAGWPDNPLLYLHGSLVSDNYPRPRGTLVTGAMLTSVVASGWAVLWFDREVIRGRWLRLLLHGILATAMFFAFSRSIVTLAVVMITAELWRRDSPPWARGLWLLALAAYAALLWISLRYHVVLNPMQPWAVDALAEDGDRFGRWRIAVAVIAENPVFGLGPGVAVADGWSAHNTWLNLWAGLGVVPLLAFAVALGASVRTELRAGWTGIACALVFALVESSYNDIEDMRHVWLLIGIALGAGRAAGGAHRAPAAG